MPKKKKLKKIVTTNYQQSTDNLKCNLKFLNCDDNRFQLWNLSKTELKDFVSFAKKIEGATWSTILSSKGYNFEEIKELKKPDYISDDITIKSIRVNKRFRIFGYRIKNDFYMVWFVSHHELT